MVKHPLQLVMMVRQQGTQGGGPHLVRKCRADGVFYDRIAVRFNLCEVALNQPDTRVDIATAPAPAARLRPAMTPPGRSRSVGSVVVSA